MLKRITISDRYYQKNMKIREFGYELLKYLMEHSNVYKVNHNLSNVWDDDGVFPNENPKYCIILKSDVAEDMANEIEEFIDEQDFRIPFIVEVYAPNVVEVEGIYYSLSK